MVQITLKEESITLTLAPAAIVRAIRKAADQAAQKHGYTVRQEGIEWPGGNRRTTTSRARRKRTSTGKTTRHERTTGGRDQAIGKRG